MGKEYDVVGLLIEDVKEMIYNGDDSHRNQIRVTKDGKVFLSQDIVGSCNLDNIAFRFDTFDAGNDYVGGVASEDYQMIKKLHEAIVLNWASGCKNKYIDYWQ